MARKTARSIEKKIQYYTINPVPWDSYEGKSLRNNSPFEIDFVGESKKEPGKFMVYPVEREYSGSKQTTYYLAEHTLKDTESVKGYSKYNMECHPLYELELVKKMKKESYALYKPKSPARKRTSRRIKQTNTPVTKFLI